ncbi:MAG: tetratricopeptide repeat protein [Verrucomicrobiales bacterium]|nr:tetratricopeptide repeat protein [Verrucomicrobiales bacterium]
MDTPTGIESPPGHFASWQPGAAPRRIPEGLAWTLLPGSDLVIQMHLQPLGRIETIESEIGFYFTDQAPTQQPVKIALNNFDIDLPPGSMSNVVRDSFTLPGQADLLGLLPHTHYLGRRIESIAHLPDGTQRPLFLIPDWDFNWQGDYQFKNPVRLPSGTRIEMAITFDNSTNNARNPFSPPRHTRYGPNTTDEMAELWMQLLPTSPTDAAAFRKAAFDRGLRDVNWVNRERLRINPRDAAAHVNLGRVLLAQRRPADATKEFEEAARLDPQLDEAHYFLGLTHRLANRPAQAIEAFTRAVEINPDHARAHGNLGLVLLDAQQLEKAGLHLSQAARLDPRDALALAKLGALRVLQGQPAEAIPLLERALSLDPSDRESAQFLELARRRLNPGPVPLP